MDAEEHYAQAYTERFETIEEDEKHECENCQSTMIDIDEHFCNNCKKRIQEQFKTLLIENFSKEEIEYIDEIIEGQYLVDYLGMEI